MKKIINITGLMIMAMILNSITGCKKYGFNIPDGYGEDTLKENITVDTTDSRPDYSMLNQAKIFPGIVDPSEPRLQNYQVKLNMNYLDESKANSSHQCIIYLCEFGCRTGWPAFKRHQF